MTTGICPGCRNVFTVNHPRAIWCSEACRIRVKSHLRREANRAAPRTPQCGQVDEWDGVTRRSTPYGTDPKHEARCLHCGRVVLPSDGLLWIEAVKRQRCMDCRGTLLIEEQDSPGAGSGSAEAVRRFHMRYSQPIPTGRVA